MQLHNRLYIVFKVMCITAWLAWKGTGVIKHGESIHFHFKFTFTPPA